MLCDRADAAAAPGQCEEGVVLPGPVLYTLSTDASRRLHRGARPDTAQVPRRHSLHQHNTPSQTGKQPNTV